MINAWWTLVHSTLRTSTHWRITAPDSLPCLHCGQAVFGCKFGGLIEENRGPLWRLLWIGRSGARRRRCLVNPDIFDPKPLDVILARPNGCHSWRSFGQLATANGYRTIGRKKIHYQVTKANDDVRTSLLCVHVFEMIWTLLATLLFRFFWPVRALLALFALFWPIAKQSPFDARSSSMIAESQFDHH